MRRERLWGGESAYRIPSCTLYAIDRSKTVPSLGEVNQTVEIHRHALRTVESMRQSRRPPDPRPRIRISVSEVTSVMAAEQAQRAGADVPQIEFVLVFQLRHDAENQRLFSLCVTPDSMH